LVEFGGIGEKLGEGLLKLKGEVHDCYAWEWICDDHQ
jgi:hypothetical protein